MEAIRRTLVYKRTHRGDPDDSGVFGVNDCMGRMRGWDFNAVIGVGGSHPDVGHEEIARKVNWIGIGPYEVGSTARGPLLSFEVFRRFDEVGPAFEESAPKLFQHMFVATHVRALLSQNCSEIFQNEVEQLLRWAENHKHLPKPRPLAKRGRPVSCGC